MTDTAISTAHAPGALPAHPLAPVTGAEFRAGRQVLAAAAEKEAPAERKAEAGEQPFASAELAKHFAKGAAKYRERFPETAQSLDALATAAESDTLGDLEEVERLSSPQPRRN